MLKPEYNRAATPMSKIVGGLSCALVCHLLSQCHVSVGFSVFQEVDAHFLIE